MPVNDAILTRYPLWLQQEEPFEKLVQSYEAFLSAVGLPQEAARRELQFFRCTSRKNRIFNLIHEGIITNEIRDDLIIDASMGCVLVSQSFVNHITKHFHEYDFGKLTQYRDKNNGEDPCDPSTVKSNRDGNVNIWIQHVFWRESVAYPPHFFLRELVQMIEPEVSSWRVKSVMMECHKEHLDIANQYGFEVIATHNDLLLLQLTEESSYQATPLFRLFAKREYKLGLTDYEMWVCLLFLRYGSQKDVADHLAAVQTLTSLYDSNEYEGPKETFGETAQIRTVKKANSPSVSVALNSVRRKIIEVEERQDLLEGKSLKMKNLISEMALKQWLHRNLHELRPIKET